MKCPNCNQEMKLKKDDLSNNGKEGKEYKQYTRKIYWCENDDIWVSIETPSFKPHLQPG